jgi:hypothetical protein
VRLRRSLECRLRCGCRWRGSSRYRRQTETRCFSARHKDATTSFAGGAIRAVSDAMASPALGSPLLFGSIVRQAFTTFEHRYTSEDLSGVGAHLLCSPDHVEESVFADGGLSLTSLRIPSARPPLRCLEGLGEVPSVSPHLAVAQLANDHEVQYPTVAVFDDPLDNPQSLLDQHLAHLERRRRGGLPGTPTCSPCR